MTHVNKTDCKYSADIVPYMYGELTSGDTSSFESHLQQCGVCTDEFASISSARYEVYDWKKVAFDPLSTPAIVIPFGEVANVPLVERLRAVFAQSWAVPGFAFAAIALVAVFAAVAIVNLDNETPQLAANNAAGTSAPLPPSPQPAAPAPPRDEVTSINEVDPDQEKVRPVRSAASQLRHQVRTTDRSIPKRVETSVTAATSQDTRAPRLNEFSEEEDNSLRLAELFEDIETSD